MPPANGPTEQNQRSRPAPGWAETLPMRVLCDLVGVEPDVSLDQLRAAYDLAMHRATRVGDHQHALTLSRAYDCLPATIRHGMYPSSRAVGERPAQLTFRREFPAFPGPVLLPRRPRRRRSRTFWVRVVGYGLVVPLAVGIGTYVGAHRGQQQQVVQQIRGPVVPAAPAGGLSTAPTLRGSAAPVIVPTNAPVGANGLVTLVCQAAQGGPGYVLTAPRGAVVECSNGATAAVVG